MKTYYIEFERQGWTLCVIKVEADSYEEAKMKALMAWHVNDDIGEISEESAMERLQSGDIDYIIDEDGNEIDMDDEEENEIEEKFIVHLVDESGFDSDYEYDSQDDAIGAAVKIWNDGDGGYQQVSVHQLRKEQSAEDISKENQIWYVDHHM